MQPFTHLCEIIVEARSNICCSENFAMKRIERVRQVEIAFSTTLINAGILWLMTPNESGSVLRLSELFDWYIQKLCWIRNYYWHLSCSTSMAPWYWVYSTLWFRPSINLPSMASHAISAIQCIIFIRSKWNSGTVAFSTAKSKGQLIQFNCIGF